MYKSAKTIQQQSQAVAMLKKIELTNSGSGQEKNMKVTQKLILKMVWFASLW